MTKIYVGIDTGINGAAVALDEYGEIMGSTPLHHKREIACYSKTKFRSVLDEHALDGWLDCFENIDRIVIEESPPFNMGVTSAYTSGYNSGRLASLCQHRMMSDPGTLVEVVCRRLVTVSPRRWQKDLFADVLEESGGKWSKAQSILQAQLQHGVLTLFDTPKRTADGFADACHIAEWGRRQ